MAVQGPRKGESSYDSMRYGFRTQPARLVRGSSRRIMTMRFRPANIRVINRRVCSSAAIGPAVQNRGSGKHEWRERISPRLHRPNQAEGQRGTKPTVSFPFGIPILPSTRLRAHQRERVPARPPVEAGVDARTVLDVKGSLRRAKHRRALDICAPFRPDRNCDGRLRREHSTARAKNNGRRSSRWSERRPKTKHRQTWRGLTGSLHIRIVMSCSMKWKIVTARTTKINRAATTPLQESNTNAGI